jgi:hypothetical protein
MNTYGHLTLAELSSRIRCDFVPSDPETGGNEREEWRRLAAHLSNAYGVPASELPRVREKRPVDWQLQARRMMRAE